MKALREIISKDGSAKYLIGLDDAHTVEGAVYD